MLDEEHEEEESEERWLITYADMITLLMAFFIMMYAMSRVDQDKFAALATSVRIEFTGTGLPSGPDVTLVNQGIATSLGIVNGTRFGLRNNVEKLFDKTIKDPEMRKHVQVLEADDNLVIRLLDDDVLFPSGSARLTEKNRRLVAQVATVLHILPYRICIEGHTDSVPINTDAFPSNWELSIRRATNVAIYLIRRHNLSPDRISAAGYADTKPVAPNDTPHNRRKNRRIDMVIYSGHEQAPVADTAQPAQFAQPAQILGGAYTDTGLARTNIIPPIDITAPP